MHRDAPEMSSDLERLIKRAALVLPYSEKEPQALVLPIIEIRCRNCGTTYTAPNSHCLIRYNNNDRSNTINYTATDTETRSDLPHETKVIHQTAPFCHQCF